MLLAAYSKGKRSCVEQGAHKDACGSNFGNLWSGLGVLYSDPDHRMSQDSRWVGNTKVMCNTRKKNRITTVYFHCMMFLFVPYNPLRAELVSHSLWRNTTSSQSFLTLRHPETGDRKQPWFSPHWWLHVAVQVEPLLPRHARGIKNGSPKAAQQKLYM